MTPTGKTGGHDAATDRDGTPPAATSAATAAEPDVEAEGTPEAGSTETEATVRAEEAGEAAGSSLWTRWWVLVPFYAVVALAVTWPLVGHLTDSISYGAEPTTTVPLFNLWTMEWNRIQIGHLYAGYWDAPIFYPTHGAFALSEPQPVTGLVFAPLSWLSGNPVLAYNLVSLLILAVNGYAGSRLARTLGAAPGPAALLGVMAVGTPFVAHQMGVLQLTAVFPLLLLMEAILRWAPGGGRWPAARIGLWLAVTFLTCGYYGLFAVVGIGLVSLVLARRQWLTRERLAKAGWTGLTFAVLALPVLLGQAHYTSDYHREDDVIRDLSASAGDYWQLDEKALGAGVVPWVRDLESGHGLYPGTALIALAVAGLLLSGRRHTAALPAIATPTGATASGTGATAADSNAGDAGTAGGNEAAATGNGGGDAAPTAGDPDRASDAGLPAGGGSSEPNGEAAGGREAGTSGEVQPVAGPEGSSLLDERRRPWFLFVGLCLAWVLSRGLKLEVLGFEPYEVIRSLVPGYDELRSPFRFAVLGELFLLGLAAYGLDALWHWHRGLDLGPRRVPAGPVLATAIVAVGVMEVTIAPVHIVEVETSAPWVDWMEENARPPDVTGRAVGAGSGGDVAGWGDRTVVAYVPFPASGKVVEFRPAVERMVQAVDADLTTVSGYSGLFPEEYERLAGLMSNYPNEEADALLHEYGVQYLIVDVSWLNRDPDHGTWLVSRHHEVYNDGETAIFELVA